MDDLLQFLDGPTADIEPAAPLRVQSQLGAPPPDLEGRRMALTW